MIIGQESLTDLPGAMLSGGTQPRLFVRRAYDAAPLAQLNARPAVLYVHGATFPSALSVGYRMDGRSWADELASSGFDIWAFDFAGYGHSSRYPEQLHDPVGAAPVGRASVASEQLVRVLEHIVAMRGGGRVAIIAHSWGTIVAGLAATLRPDLLDRLILFGAIGRRLPATPAEPITLGSWHELTVAAQYARFVEDVPAGHPRLLTDQFHRWSAEWLTTDTTAYARTPPSVRTPSGPRADIVAAWSGHLPYNPQLIQAPTSIVRGEWDSLCTDTDAENLLAELTVAPMRRDIKLDRGTHLMHLESGRFALYRAVTSALTQSSANDAVATVD